MHLSSGVAFIVLLAGPGIPGEEILYLQSTLIARANGAGEAGIALNRALQERMFAVLKQTPDSTQAAEALRRIMSEAFARLSEEEKAAAGLQGVDEETMIRTQLPPLLTPWFRYFLTYDPRPALEQVRIPVLAITGEKDLQVPPGENLAAIEEALRIGGNPHYTIQELPGLNHLFQTATTGAPSEYGQIEETFSPGALQVIGDWIREQVGQ